MRKREPETAQLDLLEWAEKRPTAEIIDLDTASGETDVARQIRGTAALRPAHHSDEEAGMNRIFGSIAWRIGCWGVAHGKIGRSRFFDFMLAYGGAWAFRIHPVEIDLPDGVLSIKRQVAK